MKDDIDLYSIYREYIKHEDALINNRMTWMLTIHGFLYATYGFTLQKLIEIYEKSANEVALNICTPYYAEYYLHNVSLNYTIEQIKIFLLCIAFVGLAISGFALLSIKSAYDAVFSLRNMFADDFSPHPVSNRNFEIYKIVVEGHPHPVNLPLLTGGGRPAGAKSGFKAAWWIPTCLFLSWIVSIVVVVFANGWSVFQINPNTNVPTCQIVKPHIEPYLYLELRPPLLGTPLL